MGSRWSSSPWRWIPTLYFGQGIPYVVVMTLSVIMYKNLGVSNTDIALYTSWLYLPWVIKPLWSPLVDIFRTKRFWIVTLQLLIGASLALVASHRVNGVAALHSDLMVQTIFADYARIGRVTSLVFLVGAAVVWAAPDTTRRRLDDPATPAEGILPGPALEEGTRPGYSAVNPTRT